MKSGCLAKQVYRNYTRKSERKEDSIRIQTEKTLTFLTLVSSNSFSIFPDKKAPPRYRKLQLVLEAEGGRAVSNAHASITPAISSRDNGAWSDLRDWEVI